MKTRRSRRIPVTMAVRGREKRRTGGKVWLLPSASAVLLGASACVVLMTGLFEIREIRIHGSRNLRLEPLREKTGVFVGANVFTVPLSRVRELIKSDPSVGSVTFRRRLPHRLDCYLREREPVALISMENMAEVDVEGVVIPSGSSSTEIDLPVITGLDKADLATDSGKVKILSALKVLGLLKEFGFSPAEQLSEIHMDGDDVILVWMDSGTMVTVGRESFEHRIRKFRAVYPSLRQQGGLPGQIDLRFDRQVVVR